MATLQTHFRGRGGLIQNLAIEAEFLHHFFCASLPFGQSRFVAKNLIFSRPDFFAKKTGSPSFVSFSCLSCSHTVDHHYYLSQIECKDISFFFSSPNSTRSQLLTNHFFGDLLPESFPKSLQFHRSALLSWILR